MSDGRKAFDEEGFAAEEFDLLDGLLDAEGVEATRSRPITKRGAKVAPLSSAQRRLWFLHEMETRSTAYSIAGAALLRGTLDPAALETALNHVVDRHEALRTTFEAVADEPRQIIHRAMPVELERTTGDGARADDEAARIAVTLARRPWDLCRGPLVRAALIRFSPVEQALAIAMHHIISDGWSIGVLLREIGMCYNARVKGHPPVLDELPAQYADYAAWQLERLTAGDLAPQLAYWREALAHAPSVLNLPTDLPGQVRSARRGAVVRFDIDRATTDAVEEAARRDGATPFAALLACFEALLGRLSAQTDFLVGTPIANRTEEETSKLVGLFVNTVPVRADLSGDPTLRDLVVRARDAARSALAHGDAPFELIVEAAGAARLSGRTPLVQVMFAFQDATGAALHLEGLDVESIDVDDGTAKFDLLLSVEKRAGRLACALEYDADLFLPETSSRIAAQYARLVGALAGSGSARLRDVDLLTGEERRHIVTSLNATERERPCPATVLGMLEVQVARTPAAIAVESGTKRVTYAELDARSNGLAWRLLARGVTDETRVGLMGDNSIELVAALLGVLKCGACLVPLDAFETPARLAGIARDAEIEILIASKRFAPRASSITNAVLELDAEADDDAAACRSSAPRARAGSLSLACIVFDPASMGPSPTGIMITHGGLANSLAWAAETCPYASPSGVPAHAPLVSELTLASLLATLVSGGCVVLPEERDASTSLAALVRTDRGFGLLRVTPAYLDLIAEAAGVERAAGITGCFVVGGDGLRGGSLGFWRTNAPRTRILHVYGPAGASFSGCGHEVDPAAAGAPGDPKAGTVPIGRPIPNCRVYVLDRGQRLVPFGEPGELYMGGAGVARGCARRPELTAERFLPDPFSPQPGARMYRTGDRARLRSDGQIDLLGDPHRQVRVRGHRFDPIEVEDALLRHQAVRQAVVVAQRQAGQDVRLAAFFVSRGEVRRSILREHLRSILPEYMVPSRLTRVRALPLTPHGSVDRAALAAIEASPDDEETHAYVAPATAIEEVVAAVWAELLGLDRVGATESFFDLGGHSLVATRVVARLRRALGVELPLRALFDTPTVQGLARRIDAGRRAPGPPIERASAEERLGLSYAQQRLWFLDRLEPGSAAYNIANAIRIQGALDVEALGRALTEIASRHEALRTRFEDRPDGPIQVIDPPSPVVIQREDLAGIDRDDLEREAARRAGSTAREAFDLAGGPLLRARLLRLGPEDHVLVLVLHHIAADGWSMGVLVNELALAYTAYLRHERPTLPELPIQYADWAAWQRAWLELGEMERQLAWWRAELDGLAPLALPTDRARPVRPTYAGASLDVRLDPALVGSITRLARAEGATLHMALLAAFAALLSRWSGQRDFGIGTPVANRTREETEPLIGFFVNTLVVRAQLDGSRLTFRDLLGRIREAALGAYANQDVPFERVVETLQPERDLSRTPLFQVMFILQNAPAADLDLGSVKLSSFDAPTATSTFDMTLSLAPQVDRLEGFIEYSTELFDEETIRRLWDHFVRLLETVATEPSTEIRRARLLGREAVAQALDDWSGRREVAAAEGRRVHELFAAQAASHPARVAAVLGDRRVTYAEIEERSNRLAARLIELGVGPESRVGLCVERSPDLLIGMMGTLKAGGAFVPLDPDHPRERLAFALDDSGARVALATRASAPLMEGTGRRIVLLDEERAQVCGPGGPTERWPAASLAYVIYTSGTTGRPKGVMITHRALTAAYHAWERLYGLDGIRGHLQMAGVAFDVCTGDVVRALCSGGTLVFCERDRLLDPERLLELAHREQVEFAEFVPAVLRLLASHPGERGRLDSIRVAVVGSDVWTSAEIAEFRSLFDPSARLANSYGVTEATIDSTCWFVGEGQAAASPPIGRPLAHTTVYVLDEYLEPCPPGLTGEIYLGGPAVARGYIDRPDLTAERFVPDPFGGAGARLYRTGDRARYLADGRLAFSGRVDEQVKIRGQRVEPAEVEAALASLDSVAACAVVARRDAAGLLRLAAYVVPRGDGAFDAERVRRLLRQRLPEAMVPSAIVVLEALPLTTNGKVDRRHLPEPEWGAPEGDEPTRTPAEAAVAAAFADVLGLDRVGAGGDFFALGGHSLLATQVISRVRASLGVEVPLRALFEAPTVRAFAERVVEAFGGAPAAPPPVRRATEPERRRLSYAQRRLWFLDRLHPGSAAYNLPSSVLLRGDLDVAALGRALTELVRRHEALRTRFVEGLDAPEQVVDEPMPVPLGVEDLSGLPEKLRSVEAQRLTSEEARRPFDLARGPLLRAGLLRLGADEHLLLVTLHHISADGWSLGVFVRELSALYQACTAGKPDSLAELRVQYADWAAWQRAWLEGGEMERQLAFWRRELDGVETLALATDLPRPARPTYAGASVGLRMDLALRRKLERFAAREGSTLHMALLAGYAATLSRWSGQKDFAVGTPVANRRTVEAESLIGFFVNTLALRVRLGGRDLTYRDLLRRVRGAALGAYANQDVPFERVVEEIQPERYLGHNPVVQTLFALQNAPVGDIGLPGLSIAYDEPETGLTRFDVELFLAETEAGVEGMINYSTELFDRETIERFAENLRSFLEVAVESPDRPLLDIPSLAPPQLRRVLVEWNATNEPYPDPPIAHALFERQAALQPDTTAALAGDRRLTYRELNARANQLARFLRKRGIGAEDLVAVCIERSFEMLTALLATMKAGAAYVPVDPEYPRDRIALILKDAGCAVVLTQSGLAGRLAGHPAHAIRLDKDWAQISAEEDSNLGLEVPPDAIVYSVYTSGSTGRPKGVAMTHRAISNLLSWQRRDSGAPRTLQYASLSFDVSFQEIFSTLTAGGAIVLVTEEERRDASRLLRLIAERGVERLFLPFVALNQLAETATVDGLYPACLSEVNTAGEQLKITPAIAALFSRLPGCRLVNHYGPSETHLVTTFDLEREPSSWPELPSIGRPITNARVYLLDDDARAVPIGVPGEIHVGGAGLARGYHDRPDLTAGQFRPDPFSGEPGARLYRTGDIARFRTDGTLEFLGRRDLQVKVRGYRVEPGEVETALGRHPAVRRAVVAAHDHRTGKRLAAYVVLDEGAHVAPGDLREYLARTLPEFMVPSAFVPLAALPITPNGKVDRSALPEPDWGAGAEYAAPRSPEEELVCGIFAEVLELDRVGVHDDFFVTGGHSLLATQVISRVRRSFGAEVPLRALFETPTPAGVAAAAVAARGSGAPTPPPIRRASEPDRRAPSYAQRRLWFLHQLEPSSAVYNLPTAVRLEGDLDVDALRRALGEIVRRHEALRTRFVDGSNGPEQVVDDPHAFPLEPEDLSSAAGATEVAAHRILAEEAKRPFDLARGPILRVRLLRLSDRTHVLSLVAHHIAADGWSMAVLLRELGVLYEACVFGVESPLDPLPIQYADWSAWQRAWLEGGELDRQLAHWRRELSGAPSALELATDRARPSTASWRGATLEVRLPAALHGRLARLARSEGATLHMALLAGYASTLMRYSGQLEVVVGTPVANRRAAEAEPLVGFFVNTLAVRVRGGGRQTFRELLASVREASLGSYANQDVPFERVVEELQPERALNRAPLFQTAFVLQNARLPRVDLSGLSMTSLEVDTGTSKFDLMLTLVETEDGLTGACEYSTDLFDRATIERILSHFERVLAAAVASPDTRLAEIPLLSEAEERRVLAGWNATETRLEGPALLHELVERQVARTPRSLALAYGSTAIAYAEMEERANRLANLIVSLGVGPEGRVALLLERSVEAIIAMLAVLKTGAAYVPLDPEAPAERLAYLVEDSGSALVLTEDRFAGKIDGTRARLIRLDAESIEIARFPASRPDGRARPGNLAYVIYTSGSTGQPKGVGIEHRQIAGYVAAAVQRLGMTPGWRFAIVSTLAADLGNTSIFPALATGGCLHLLPSRLAFDPAGVEAYFAEHAIDALKIVPSHLQALMSGSHPQRVIPRRLLVLGGEAMPGDRLDGLRERAPACLIANHYGPTETTVGAIAGFSEASDAARTTVPLGIPLANTRAYLLDERLRPVPDGMPGSLLLAGSGVSRGYLGRPALTADRFVPDPFSREPGARMYRTGDRARRLRDGRLEFLGRSDGQVKVRGHRVELGEIEAAIARHPGVREAVVVARADAAAGTRLTAYVLPAPRLSPTIHGLARRRLSHGPAVAEINRNETDYIYREIFELGSYVRHGITLRDGDTVFDVGANIGLFTVFASLACASPRIFAFEPNPHLHAVLRANAEAYAPAATVVDVGLAESAREATFTFFPGFSLLSGIYADAESEKQVVRSYLESQERAGADGAARLAKEADTLLGERFNGLELRVRLRTLSDVIAEHRVDRIDLFKVNVEKAELDVLRGVGEADWPRIDQAVVEVDTDANLAPILSMFEAHDFDVIVEKDPLLEKTELCYVYAARRGSGRSLVRGAAPSFKIPRMTEPVLTAEAMTAHLTRSLPDYMRPAAWVFLEAFPLTANGKLDRSRLPAPAQNAHYVAPRGELERAIAGIWSEALGIERVGAHDNFFDLGGHSLLLARVHARLRESLGVEMSVVELFQFPTIALLAARLAGTGAAPSPSAAHRERGARRRGAVRARATTRRESVQGEIP